MNILSLPNIDRISKLLFNLFANVYTTNGSNPKQAGGGPRVSKKS